MLTLSLETLMYSSWCTSCFIFIPKYRLIAQIKIKYWFKDAVKIILIFKVREAPYMT